MWKKLLCSLLAAGLLALLPAISTGVGPASAENICDGCGHIIGGHGAPAKSGGDDNCVALCGLSVTPPKVADTTDCPPSDSGSPLPVRTEVNLLPTPIAVSTDCPPGTDGSSKGKHPRKDPILSDLPLTDDPNGGDPGGSGPAGCIVPDGKIHAVDGLPFCPKGKTKAPLAAGAGGAKTSATQRDCDTQLANLRDVSEREVRSVDNNDRVRLVPICDTLVASLTQVHVDLAVHGNAASLIPAIARNNTLYASLHRARYTPDNVVGIVMARDLVILYVHKR